MQPPNKTSLWSRYGSEPVMGPSGLPERDRALYDDLCRVEFQGPLAGALNDDLWRYGWDAVRSWMRDGTIAARCAAAGYPMAYASTEIEAMAGSAELREDLAAEAVPPALRDFMDFALPQGDWKPWGGRSMRSYFAVGCLFHFRNAFNAWARPRRGELSMLAERLYTIDWSHDPFEERWAQRDILLRVAARMPSAEGRAVLALLWTERRTHEDVGEQLQMTVRSVEYHMRKARAVAREMLRAGQIENPFPSSGPAGKPGR